MCVSVVSTFVRGVRVCVCVLDDSLSAPFFTIADTTHGLSRWRTVIWPKKNGDLRTNHKRY